MTECCSAHNLLSLSVVVASLVFMWWFIVKLPWRLLDRYYRWHDHLEATRPNRARLIDRCVVTFLLVDLTAMACYAVWHYLTDPENAMAFVRGLATLLIIGIIAALLYAVGSMWGAEPERNEKGNGKE